MISKKEVRAAKVKLADHFMEKHSLHVVHVRPDDDVHMKPAHKNGATIVWNKHHKDDRVINVSIALVNEKDSYCKLTGRLLAVTRFDAGNTVQLRVPKNTPTSMFLKRTFAYMVNT